MWLLGGLIAAVGFLSISVFFTLRVNGLMWQETVQTSDQIKIFMVYLQRLAIVTRVHLDSFRTGFAEFMVVQQAS